MQRAAGCPGQHLSLWERSVCVRVRHQRWSGDAAELPQDGLRPDLKRLEVDWQHIERMVRIGASPRQPEISPIVGEGRSGKARLIPKSQFQRLPSGSALSGAEHVERVARIRAEPCQGDTAIGHYRNGGPEGRRLVIDMLIGKGEA